MKRAILVLFYGWMACSVVNAQSLKDNFVPGQLFVKVHTDLNVEIPQFRSSETASEMLDFPEIDKMIRDYGIRAFYKPFKTQAPTIQRIYFLEFDAEDRTEALIEAWQELSFIEYAERIPVYRQTYTPNDQNFFSWHLPQIDAELAWDISKGDRDIIVAIIDDAVRLDHEDLNAQIWVNTGEIAGDSIDNDNNGFIDDVNGYDVADDDNDPNPPAGATNNAFSHGTHVSGIAAASSDNGVGISSIGFNLTIMPIKTKEDATIGTNQLQATLLGLDYAIINKAHVANMSFGSDFYNASFDFLTRAAVDSGLVLVASAGNTGDYQANYPASYSDVISVASTNFSDQKSGFSSYHATVDVSAPGSNIYSTVAGTSSSYGFKSGTSMSSPVVTGLVGLMRSVNNDLTPLEYRLCLRNSADNIDAQNPNYTGWLGFGRVNAKAALNCVTPVQIRPVSNRNDGLKVNYIFPNPASGNTSLSAILPYAGNLRLSIRDMKGRDIAILHEGPQEAGLYEQIWNGSEQLASGLYLVIWEFEGEVLVQKLNWN